MFRRVVRVPLWVAFLGVVASGCSSCGPGSSSGSDPGEQAPAEPPGRLIVLGFDGVDPDWLEKWAKQGKLPHMRELMQADGGSGFRRLGSTNPPQSPVAWTSFATGTRPGDHGIFDFIRRRLVQDPDRMPVMPAVGTTEFKVHEVGPPTARNLRNGVPFWKTLADRGVPVVAVSIPYSFPPDPMKNGHMLSGLGVPDLRGTNSTFTYVGTDVTQQDVENPPGGGVMVPLEMDGRTGQFELKGPSIPGSRQRMSIPVELEVPASASEGSSESGAGSGKTQPDKGSGAQKLIVRVQGETLRLPLRKFSSWVELVFRHGQQEIHGLAKFLPLEVGGETRLFITPMSFHPRKPYAPISYPREFAGKLAEELGGPYKTVGWDHDTSALNAEVIDEGLFLRDMDVIEDDRRAMLMHALERDDWRTLIWVSTSTDRVAHMFYRLIDPKHPMYDAELAEEYGDAIEQEYRRMDETVGKVMKRLEDGDRLLILSDHGFHNFRRGLHVNTWLKTQGLLALQGDKEYAKREFLMEVDWSRTKAYAMGTGQIYLNLRGREREGIVSESEAPEVLDQIEKGLLALRDEERDGARVVREVYRGSKIFKGERSHKSPDLQIAFAENYRTSWSTVLGGVPKGLIVNNDRKWSGDHAASDVETTSGILLSNKPLRKDVEIVDMAPTALQYFGKTPPGRYDGQTVLPGGG
jgi:predicted AlkP superfamily phosphohydrolase/phosphomutase